MRKYLSGLVALGLAIGAFAFTNAPTGKEQQISGKYADPCTENNKKWFLISLDCNSQVSVADLRNPSNYTLSSTQEVTALCAGSECVCAIWACPVYTAGQYRPNIGSSTTIYTELYNYFNFGMTYSTILIKDQQFNRVAR